MKKIILFTIASCLICNLSFSQTDEKKEKKASKLGSFLKKTVEATTGLNVSDEIYMTQENNKLVGEADIGFVGCYGDSKTGNVYLVLTVNFHNDDGKFSLSIPAAVSSKGKVYKNDKSLTFETVKGVPVELNTEKAPIKNVPASLKHFESIKIYTHLVGRIVEHIYLHNVPILWDEKPEE